MRMRPPGGDNEKKKKEGGGFKDGRGYNTPHVFSRG